MLERVLTLLSSQVCYLSSAMIFGAEKMGETAANENGKVGRLLKPGTHLKSANQLKPQPDLCEVSVLGENFLNLKLLHDDH